VPQVQLFCDSKVGFCHWPFTVISEYSLRTAWQQLLRGNGAHKLLSAIQLQLQYYALLYRSLVNLSLFMADQRTTIRSGHES